MQDYSYVSTVGEGAYGQVWKCQQVSTGDIVAVKGFKEAHEDPQIMRLALREVRILKTISHPNCVKLLQGFRSTTGRIYLVFEYVPGSALALLQDTRGKGMPSAVLKRLAWGMLQAVQYLHENKIIHRDIKPANVLLTTGQQVKLCDFGFARFTDCSATEAQHLTTYMVTRWYRAPEVLAGDDYGPASDIWSLGATLAELATGQALFPGKSSLDQLWLIMRCLGPLTYGQRQCCIADPRLRGLAVPKQHKTLRQRLQGLEEPLVQLIEACLQVDPAERKTAKELLQLPCFRDMQAAADECKTPPPDWPACPTTPPMPVPWLPQSTPAAAATGTAAASPDPPATPATATTASLAAPGLRHATAAAVTTVQAKLPADRQVQEQHHVQGLVQPAAGGRASAAADPRTPPPAMAAGAAADVTSSGAVAAAAAAVASGCRRLYRMVADGNSDDRLQQGMVRPALSRTRSLMTLNRSPWLAAGHTLPGPGAHASPAPPASAPSRHLPDAATEDVAGRSFAAALASLEGAAVTRGSTLRGFGTADGDSQAPLQLINTPMGTQSANLWHVVANERLPHRRPEFTDSRGAYPAVDPRIYDSGPCSGPLLASNFRRLSSMGNSDAHIGCMQLTQWSSAWSCSGAGALKTMPLPSSAATTRGYLNLYHTAGPAEGQHVPASTPAGNPPTSLPLKVAWPAAAAPSGSGGGMQRSMSALLLQSNASAVSLHSNTSITGMVRAPTVGPSRLRGALAAVGGFSETRPGEARADAWHGSAGVARATAAQTTDLGSGQLSTAESAHMRPAWVAAPAIGSVQAAALLSSGGPEAAAGQCGPAAFATEEPEPAQPADSMLTATCGACCAAHTPQQQRQLSKAQSLGAMAPLCRSRSSSLGSLAEGAEGAGGPPQASANADSTGSDSSTRITALCPSTEKAAGAGGGGDGATRLQEGRAGAGRNRQQGRVQRFLQRLVRVMSCTGGPGAGAGPPSKHLEGGVCDVRPGLRAAAGGPSRNAAIPTCCPAPPASY